MFYTGNTVIWYPIRQFYRWQFGLSFAQHKIVNIECSLFSCDGCWHNGHSSCCNIYWRRRIVKFYKMAPQFYFLDC